MAICLPYSTSTRTQKRRMKIELAETIQQFCVKTIASPQGVYCLTNDRKRKKHVAPLMRFVERSRQMLVQLMLVPEFVIRDIVEIQSCFFEPPMPT